jgi:hypothetical protein
VKTSSRRLKPDSCQKQQNRTDGVTPDSSFSPNVGAARSHIGHHHCHHWAFFVIEILMYLPVVALDWYQTLINNKLFQFYQSNNPIDTGCKLKQLIDFPVQPGFSHRNVGFKECHSLNTEELLLDATYIIHIKFEWHDRVALESR